MIIITCIGVLTVVARTLAEANGEVACCPPDKFLSFSQVEGKAVCFEIGSNDSSPTTPNCESGFYKTLYSKFIFNNDGTVNINGSVIENAQRYCVNTLSYYPKSNNTLKVGIVCYDEEEVSIIGHILIVSVVFLTLTIITYCALNEIRDLFSKSFINLCASLAIGLCIFAIINLMAEYDEKGAIPGGGCAARGYFAYFFLLASFFWTTAISTQLMLSIRSSSSVQNQGWKPFAWYALFAWGCPAIMTICMVIVDTVPGDHAKPGVSSYTCWFNPFEPKHIWYWLYGVLAILMAINIMIFIYISLFFCRNHFASSQVMTVKYRFGLAVKLFVVMGLFWIIELIATLVDNDNNGFWKFINVVTSLQGLWIFLAWVVFRKRVVKAMHRRGWLPCISGIVERRLANCDEADDDIVQPTAVTMTER